MRGFGTLLNKNEREIMSTYCSYVPFWKNLYSIDETTDINIINENIYKSLSINHKLFKPRLYNIDYFLDCGFIEIEDRYNNNVIEQPVEINENNNIIAMPKVTDEHGNLRDIETLIIQLYSSYYIV
jgi:hypothetical protein